MTSKTSSLDLKKSFLGVFLWRLRQIWPLAALYAFLLLSLSLFFRLTNPYVFHSAPGVSDLVIAAESTAVMSAVLPLFQYGFLFRRRQSDLFCALPVPKTLLFWSQYLSGLLAVWVPLLPAFLIGSSFHEDTAQAVTLADRLPLFGVLLLLGALTLAFFSLAAVCSGSVLEYIVNAVLSSLIWPALVTSVTTLVGATVPGGSHIYQNAYLAFALSPPMLCFDFLQNIGVAYDSESVSFHLPGGWVLFWAGLTAVLLALCVLAIRRRSGEGAEGALAISPFRAVVRILACGAGGLLGICTAQASNAASIPLCLLAGAAATLLCWALSELFYFLTLRRAFRRLPGAALALLLPALTVGIISTGLGLDTAGLGPVKAADVSLGMREDFFYTKDIFVRLEGENGWDSLSPSVYSPEMLEKVETLREKLIDFERAFQYPYLPGRTSKLSSYGDMSLRYILENGEPNFSPNGSMHWKYYRADSLSLSGKAKELYSECTALAEEIRQSEEYILGVPAVNAVDAAFGARFVTEEDTGEVREFPADGAQFRARLEAALIDDLTHGRVRKGGPFQQPDDNFYSRDGAYELLYDDRTVFTARGGVTSGGEPAAGGAYQLDKGSYSIELPDQDGVVRVYAYEYPVFPEMTATTALLDSLFEK